MRFSSARRSASRYAQIGPVFYDERIIGVLDGKYVLGSVNRSDVTAVRHETRKSFEHPILGLILGLALLAGSPVVLPFSILGGLFTFGLGLYVLWGVIRRRDEPCIVFRLTGSERAFPLRQRLSEEEMSALAALLPAAEQMIVPGYDPGRGRGFEVLPAKPVAVEEEASPPSG